MRNWNVHLVLAAGVSAAFVCGCQAPAPAIGPTAGSVTVADYDEFVDRALSLLRRVDLPPARVDRGRGWIESRPTTSPQWFEIGRIDAPGSYQALESSLHTIRRTVRISIQPEQADTGITDVAAASADAAKSAGPYRVQVVVNKERFSSPERQITTASGALMIFSERIPTTEGLRAGRQRADHWVPLGRDALLESELLSRLLATGG